LVILLPIDLAFFFQSFIIDRIGGRIKRKLLDHPTKKPLYTFYKTFFIFNNYVA